MSRLKKLSQTIWHCQYHIVFVPKYRYKIFAGEVAKETERCIRAFAEHQRFMFAQHESAGELQKTGSCGISNYIKLEESQQFLSRADKALCKAKANGQNRCEVL